MDLFLAPYFSFFSKGFYAHTTRQPLAKGFLYLLLLSAVMAILVFILMAAIIFPQADVFMSWVKETMPAVTVDQSGFSADRQTPYTMTHPEMGPIVTFDLEKDEISPEEMGDVPAYVTRKNIYVQQSNQIRIYPASDMVKDQKEGEGPLQVTPEVVDKFYRSFKPTALAVAFFVVLISFYLWKIGVALFYSLLGLMFNQMRVQKLSYAQILNLTMFAMTPAIIFQMIRLFVPFIATIPFISLLDFGITSAFVYFAVKMSEVENYDVPGGRGPSPLS